MTHENLQRAVDDALLLVQPAAEQRAAFEARIADLRASSDALYDQLEASTPVDDDQKKDTANQKREITAIKKSIDKIEAEGLKYLESAPRP